MKCFHFLFFWLLYDCCDKVSPCIDRQGTESVSQVQKEGANTCLVELLQKQLNRPYLFRQEKKCQKGYMSDGDYGENRKQQIITDGLLNLRLAGLRIGAHLFSS